MPEEESRQARKIRAKLFRFENLLITSCYHVRSLLFVCLLLRSNDRARINHGFIRSESSNVYTMGGLRIMRVLDIIA